MKKIEVKMTGYTKGIYDGEITNLREFAITCGRAFGAMIHLRDEPLSTPYTPKVPTDYSSKISDEETKLKFWKTANDDEILEKELAKICEEILYITSKLKQEEEFNRKCKEMLFQAENWQPPTSEHTRIKSFMIEQLTLTIDSCHTDFYKTKNAELQEKKRQIEERIFLVGELRQEKIEDCKNEIRRLKKNAKESVDFCREVNKWVEDLLNSIDSQKLG